MASHRSAAWLWGLADEHTLEVTVPKSRSPRLSDAVVHRRHLPPSVTCRRRGVPVTNPLRTLVDLAAVFDVELLDQALDRGTASRLFTDAAVEAELSRWSRRGLPGTALLRQRLSLRDASSSRPASALERRMGRLLRVAQIPPPDREHPVMAGAYRLDFAWPEQKLAVEVDGYASHSSTQAFQRDRSRQNALVVAGWTVLRFTWDDVSNQPEKVAQHIRAALGISRRG